MNVKWYLKQESGETVLPKLPTTVEDPVLYINRTNIGLWTVNRKGSAMRQWPVTYKYIQAVWHEA